MPPKIEPKFKVGDYVTVISDDWACSDLVNKVCKIIETSFTDGLGKNLYSVRCIDGSVDGEWIVFEAMLAPVPHTEETLTRITDPNTNYKELFKEPFYIEFIDVGEALEKLKHYENNEKANAVEKDTCLEDSDIRVGDVVFYQGGNPISKNIHCAIVAKINSAYITIRFPSNKTFDLKRTEVFKTYAEALAQIK